MKGDFIPELPCERLIRKICGHQWRSLPKTEMDAAWGVAIVKSVLNGVSTDIGRLATHLRVDGNYLIDAFRQLSLNGVFKPGWLESDRRALESEDLIAWGYYGGYASGATRL